MTPTNLLNDWRNGEALTVGATIMEALTPAERVTHAARVLRKCAERARAVPQVQHVLDLADSPERWPEAHDAFSALRTLTLRELNAPTEHQHEIFLHLAENVAKAIYNGSGEPAPFDHNACWRVISSARTFARALGDAEYELEIWLAASAPQSRPVVGRIVQGIIRSKREFGIFVQLDETVCGLARTVDLTDASPVDMNALPAVGTEVTCVVLGVEQTESGVRVSLSMRDSELRQAARSPHRGHEQ